MIRICCRMILSWKRKSLPIAYEKAVDKKDFIDCKEWKKDLYKIEKQEKLRIIVILLI